jgi:glycine hydroxymethyltransferase
MKESEMKRIGKWITQVLAKADDKSVQERVRGEVLAMCGQFPAPGN